MATDILDVLNAIHAKDEPYAVATVVETTGSVSAKTSAKAVIDQHGQIIAGWVGGGCAESATCEAALASMESGQTTILDIDMDDEVLGVGMPCGGSMRVYVEPVMPKPTMWLMGHGRVAECLAQLGSMMGLKVVVNDPIVTPERYPDADRLIIDDMDYDQLRPTASDYVVIATQHKGDHESMKKALSSGAGYIALIASRKRAGLVMDYLKEEGFADDKLTRVMAPAGIDLGAMTPEEIALSVMSEIVLERRQGSAQRMRDKIKAGL
ncbi:MAG: XdhC family protein [Pseudomonadota bacterium]